jgi:hypothetical protein
MPVEGAIAERTRSLLPITWDALSRDSRYGDALLRQVVDVAKNSVFGEIVLPAAEVNYPLAAIDFTAKIAAIELCTPGIDFWMNQPTSESATGTNENHTFLDRVGALQVLRTQLLEETRRLASEIAVLVGYRAFSPRRPLSNTIADEFLTPSPQEFPRPFAVTDRS